MSEITRVLWVRLLMYAMWLTVSAAAVAVSAPEKDTAVGGAILLAVVAGLGIARPFPASHWVTAGAGALIYALVQGLRASATDADPNAPYLPAAAVGAFALAVAAILADQIRHSLRTYDEELASRLRLIDELQMVDPETGAVKRAHAERLISQEVERSRRYNHEVAVVLFGPDQWEEILAERGSEAATELMVAAASDCLSDLRSQDTLIRIQHADFAAVLPETGVDGAQVVAEKLAAAARERLGVEVRAGIAVFPEDEVTGSGLMAEAEEALAFARTAHIGVASRSLLT